MNAKRLKTPPFVDPSGSAHNNQGQLLDPTKGPPAPQETGDTTPKGQTETPLEDQEVLSDKSNTPNNEQSVDPLAPQGKGDTTPKGPTETTLEDP